MYCYFCVLYSTSLLIHQSVSVSIKVAVSPSLQNNCGLAQFPHGNKQQCRYAQLSKVGKMLCISQYFAKDGQTIDGPSRVVICDSRFSVLVDLLHSRHRRLVFLFDRAHDGITAPRGRGRVISDRRCPLDTSRLDIRYLAIDSYVMLTCFPCGCVVVIDGVPFFVRKTLLGSTTSSMSWCSSSVYFEFTCYLAESQR